jgi:hypothetical protein
VPPINPSRWVGKAEKKGKPPARRQDPALLHPALARIRNYISQIVSAKPHHLAKFCRGFSNSAGFLEMLGVFFPFRCGAEFAEARKKMAGKGGKGLVAAKMAAAADRDKDKQQSISRSSRAGLQVCRRLTLTSAPICSCSVRLAARRASSRRRLVRSSASGCGLRG